MKQKKEQQIHIRVTDEQREEIKLIASNYGYKNVSKFIIDSTLDNLSKKKEKVGNMTHIISVSPTIDYFVKLSDGTKNIQRFNSNEKELIPGGRGINISKLMNVFNRKNITVHYSGGFVGSFIWEQLEKMNIDQKRIKSPENSRINLKLNLNNENMIFDQNSNKLSEYGKEEIINYISNSVTKDEFVVIAGSFVDEDLIFVKQICKIINNKKAKLILNISQSNFEKIVDDCKPYFVALNLIDKEINISRKQAIILIDKIIMAGAKEAAVIVDTNFIYYGNGEKKFFAETKTSDEQSPVGLADALIAGYLSNHDEVDEEKYKWSSATVSVRSTNQYSQSYEDILLAKKEIILKEI